MAAPVLPSRQPEPLGTRENAFFRGWTPSAHTLAYLRINTLLAEAAARLATGLPGLALAGRASHPLDDTQDFTSSSH
jgi:hypothetical protein